MLGKDVRTIYRKTKVRIKEQDSENDRFSGDSERFLNIISSKIIDYYVAVGKLSIMSRFSSHLNSM